MAPVCFHLYTPYSPIFPSWYATASLASFLCSFLFWGPHICCYLWLQCSLPVLCHICNRYVTSWDFPGGLVVTTLCSPMPAAGSILIGVLTSTCRVAKKPPKTQSKNVNENFLTSSDTSPSIFSLHYVSILSRLPRWSC